MSKATVNVYMQVAGAEQDLFHVCSFAVDTESGSRDQIVAALRELAEAFETEPPLGRTRRARKMAQGRKGA